MNTPKALAILASIESTAWRGEDVYKFILHADQVLGLHILEQMERVSAQSDVQELLDERELARSKSDYARSDVLRSQLSELGVGVEDTASGQIVWRIFSK